MSDVEIKQLSNDEFNNIVLSLKNFEKTFYQFDMALMNIMFLSEAVQRLLVEKGILTEQEIIDKAKEIDAKTAEAIQKEAETTLQDAAEGAANDILAKQEENESEGS